MDFQLSEEEEAFRNEVRSFLDANLPEGQERTPEMMADWSKKVREKRWVGFSWPADVGGGGGAIMEQVILKDEMAKRKAPSLGSCFMGLAWVGIASGDSYQQCDHNHLSIFVHSQALNRTRQVLQ